MVEAIREQTGVDFDAVTTDEEAKALAKERGIAFETHHKKGDIVNLFFDEFCEEKMVQPTFIMDHPIEISPLTKKKPSDPTKVERFELYINGWEMCNAYSELNDPIDQRERFKAQDALAAAGDEEANHTDEDFLHAMEIGMPPTGGIGYLHRHRHGQPPGLCRGVQRTAGRPAAVLRYLLGVHCPLRHGFEFVSGVFRS